MLTRSATPTYDDIASSSEEKVKNQRKDDLGVIFNVVLNYLQVLYYLGQLASNWSDLATRFFNAFGIVGALSPSNYTIQCAANWKFYDTLVFVYASPIIVVGIISIVYIVRHFLKGAEYKETKTDYQLAVMLLLYQIHPTIMLEVNSSFPCESVPGTGTS